MSDWRTSSQGRNRARALALCLGLALAARAADAAVFTVNSTGDQPDALLNGTCATAALTCTLRAALQEANNAVGPHTINFAIAGGGPHTISPASALPALNQAGITINGYSQPLSSPNTLAVGNDAVLKVELDGSLIAVDGVSGLTIWAGSCTVRGLVINRFTGYGVEITGTGAVIRGNFVGTNVAGTVGLGNNRGAVGSEGGIGLFAGSATIGGTAPADRNLVSGNNNNCGRGIELWDASGNTIQGNYVGTNAAGTAAIPNGCGGVVLDGNAGVGSDNNLVGGAVAGAGNLISGNQVEGIFVQVGSATNTIQGNTIGLNASGSAVLPNGAEGIKIQSNGNVVGGDDAFKRNVISGNTTQGVRLQGASATGNAIRGNYIGTDATGAIDLGNTSHGVILNAGAAGNTIGGLPAERNVISGNGSGAGVQGVRIDGAGTANNVVTANFIGTNAAGSGALPNSAGGIAITNSAANNRIGGVAAGAGNRIALNTTYGVNLGPTAGVGNAILGNAIYGNSDLGIDLLTDLVTPNDGGDGDSGPNDLLNFPDMTAASVSGGMLAVSFNLDVPAGSYRIEFFKNPSGVDPSGNGEGEVFAGARTLTHPGGSVAYTHSFAGGSGDRITATTTFCTDGATCAAFGSTSEFSAWVQASCCALSTAETATTVTVTGAGQFEMRFNTAAGGGIDQLYDLAEDPTRVNDLAGGTGTGKTLHGDGLRVAGVTYNATQDDQQARLSLLEATAARTRVRQEAFYKQEGGALVLAGLKAFGDYSVYGSGRVAVRWHERATANVTYTLHDLDLNVHRTGAGVLSSWVPFSQTDGTFTNPGSDDFFVIRNEVAGARTDFLHLMYQDWTIGNGYLGTANVTDWFTDAGNERGNPYWEEGAGATIVPGAGSYATQPGETWNLLTYFKPTGLIDNTDGAVTSRSADFRTHAAGEVTINAGKGAGWADAVENTAAGTDWYNESEAAYPFELHQTLGLDFTLDGATTTRYAPFFKIRQWRSFSEAPIATFDADGAGPGSATLLRKNVDYRAAVKPIARAYFTNNLAWHCTLDDTSVTNTCTTSGIDLDVGSSGGVSAGVAIVPGRYGFGASFDANTDYVSVPTGSLAEFDMGGGSLEFWYQPNQAHTVSGPLVFFYTNSANDCFVFEKTGLNALRFTIHVNASNSTCSSGGTAYTASVGSGSYSWRAKDWVHLRITWANSGLDRMAIYVNGAKLGTNGTYTSVGVTAGAAGYFGGCASFCPLGSTGNADGVIDEPHVYTVSNEPVSLAHGGLVGTADEYLADSALNTSLGLSKLDASRRGRYLYFGADSKFLGLNVNLATAGAGVGDTDVVWQYWRGGSGAWVTLAPTDGTLSLKRTGTVSWADPSGWSPMSISGGPDLYYVRAHLPVSAPSNYSVTPVERQIRTDILLFQYCPDVTTAGTFTFAVPPTTEVTLASFAATAGDGSVRLEWRTASELRNLGFHLYRAPSADGPWQRLTTSLIPGLGSSAVGQAYSWRDEGLSNGTRYFYRLEDVDAASKATSHGPVSAVPQAGASADAATGSGKDKAPGKTAAAASSCPSWVLVAYQAAVGGDASTSSLRCTRHGDPEATSFTVLSRDARSATVELRTGGFYALREGSGAVRVFVPGFDFPQDEAAAALPYRRALVEAVAGRRVQLGGVRALELQAFRDLVPAALGKAEMQVGRDGTVRAGRRGLRSFEDGGGLRRGGAGTSASAAGFAKSELVRLQPSQFQGETKSAVVEIAPLRFDASRHQLVLAKRVRVKLLFTGREPGESGRGAEGRAPRVKDQAATGEVLARLYTTSVGLHAAAFEELFPGRSRGVAVTELRLSLQGEAVAFHVEPQTSRFGPGSRLFFHADREAASTDYTGELAYELLSARDGLRMSVSAAAPDSRVISAEPVVTRTFETNRYYQPGLLDAADPWLWEAASSGATRAVSFTLAGVSASGTAALEVELQGASESGQAVDHHVSVSVNGVLAGEARFAGKRPYRMSLSLPAAVLREGANELSLTNVADTGVTSLVFLDRLSVAHPRLSVLGDGRLSAVWPASGAASVAGVTGAAFVVDVTGTGDDASSSSAAPRWLTGYAVAGGELRFEAQAGRRYEVVLGSALRSPRVSRPEPSTLRATANQADYLLIAPKAFLAAAEPLVARREDQGLAAKAVSFEEIAAEFGHGRPSAEAIRAFLSYAYQSWSRPSPRYVVLLGDSTYDPRNFSGVSQPSPLPALWTKTSYLWTASDPLLAAVNGEDALPDLAIGRLPATTPEQAEKLVAKLLAWEDSGQGLSGAATLVADNPDLAGDFEADVADIRASFLAGRETSVLKVSELGALTRPSVQQALDSGLSYLGYVGHGGAAVWASENVWNTWDAASLQAQSRQPLLVTMNCLNGYFVAPSYESLSESLVKAEGRGAIAAFSPSGLSLDGPAHQYHRALMAELTSGRHDRLGDALLAAQKAYATSGLMPELLSVYHLLGDPATRIQ